MSMDAIDGLIDRLERQGRAGALEPLGQDLDIARLIRDLETDLAQADEVGRLVMLAGLMRLDALLDARRATLAGALDGLGRQIAGLGRSLMACRGYAARAG